MTRMLVLAAVSAIAAAACSSSRPESGEREEREEQEATPVEAEPAPPSETDLFQPTDRLPLAAPLLGLLPADTELVVVLAEPERARNWTAPAAWKSESRKAVSKDLGVSFGLDLLDASSLEAAGVIPSKPLALARLPGAVYALVVPVADKPALRKALGRDKGRRLILRDEHAAILVGPATGKGLANAARAVEATATGGSLADDDRFRLATASLNVGKDVAAYLSSRGAVSGMAAGLNLRDEGVMAQVVLSLDGPGADWRTWLTAEIGTRDLKQKPAVSSAKMDAIRTVCDAAETFTVNASSLRARGIDPLTDRRIARNAGILGAFEYYGNSKKAKKKREQLEAAKKTLDELTEARDARLSELEQALLEVLGTAVAYARVDGKNVVIYGGQFFTGPSAEVAGRAADLWFAASDRTEEGKKVAEQRRRVDKLRSQLSDINAKEMFGGGAFASLTGTADFSSGLSDTDVYGGLIGNEVGEMKGGFGFGLKGTGPGGGGTGWGTIGTGSVGVIGHGGGGGTGSGYGRGYGRLGTSGRSRPKATLQSGGDEVLRVYLRQKMARVQRCYRKALAKNAKLSGTLDIQLSADDAGTITAHATGVADRTLANCAAVAAGGKSAAAAGHAGSFSISLDPGK